MTINARLRAAESVTRSSQLSPPSAGCDCCQADCIECSPTVDLSSEVSNLRNRLQTIALLTAETTLDRDAIRRAALGIEDAPDTAQAACMHCGSAHRVSGDQCISCHRQSAGSAA